MTASKSNATWEKLSNPLLLLIIGAVISGILIPSFTRQWQDHQKALEIKTDLVSRISKTIADLVLTAQLIQTTTSPIITSQSYDTAYRDWTESHIVIESQLYAYFPHTQIGQQWSNYSTIVDDSYLLIKQPDAGTRKMYVQKIQNYFSSTPSNVNWQGLIDKGNSTQYHASWFDMKNQLLNRMRVLIQSILMSKIDISGGTCPANIGECFK